MKLTLLIVLQQSENEEDQLNHLLRKFSKHEFAMIMDEILEVKNKTEILNSEESKSSCTNLRDEIKYLKEEYRRKI